MTNPLRAALYLRLSSTDDDSTSIVRQEQDLRAEAARHGWEIVRVLVDDGISGRKARAKAAEALRMLHEDEADVLAVWKLDRWTRQGLSAVGDLVRTLAEAPGTVFIALQDGLRSDQAAFGIIAAVLAETAKAEADNGALRTRSSIAHRKATGRFAGGAIPFGYDSIAAPDGPGRVLVLNGFEADVVRKIADRIILGDSMPRIALSLTADGIPTTRSAYRRAVKAGKPTEGLDRGRWTSGTVQQMWTSPHLLGRVSHHGEWIRGDDGLPLQVWEPVLAWETMARIRERVRNPKEKADDCKRRDRRPRAARLLSGVAFCAACGGKMHVRYASGAPIYACSNTADRGCETPRMMAELAERAVTERFLGVLGGSPELEAVEIVTDPGTAEELAEIGAALREAGIELTRDDSDTQLLVDRIARLKTRRAELAALPASVVVQARETGRTYGEAWEASTVDDRRRLLLSAADHVTIRKTRADEPRKGYHPDRIRIIWSTDDVFADWQ